MPESEPDAKLPTKASGARPAGRRQHPVVRGATWLVLLLGVAAASWFAAKQARLAGWSEAEADRLESQVKTLETRVAELTRERDALLGERGDLPPVRADAGSTAELEKEAAARAAADAATIKQLKETVALASAQTAKLDARVAELETDLQRVGQENDRRSASQVELSEKISGLERIVAALERENKTKSDRLVQLELANKQVREENARLSQKGAETTRISTDLQEIYRRREVHLNTMLSRYRDLNDQFRSVSGMLDTRSRGEGAAGMPDLGRLQNAISLAEEDMRQLGNLNAQALQLQRRMTQR